MKNKVITGVGIVGFIAIMFYLVTIFGGPSVPGNSLLGAQVFMATYASTTNAELIDVRTPAEYNTSHIPNAVDIDIENPTFDSIVKSLDPSKTYFVYCRSGNRSAQAVSIMQKDGFNHIYELEGGINSAPQLLK